MNLVTHEHCALFRLVDKRTLLLSTHLTTLNSARLHHRQRHNGTFSGSLHREGADPTECLDLPTMRDAGARERARRRSKRSNPSSKPPEATRPAYYWDYAGTEAPSPFLPIRLTRSLRQVIPESPCRSQESSFMLPFRWRTPQTRPSLHVSLETVSYLECSPHGLTA